MALSSLHSTYVLTRAACAHEASSVSFTLLCRCKRPPVSFNAATAVFHAHSLLGSRPSRTLSAMPCKLTRNCSAHNQCVIYSAKLVVPLCVSVLPLKDVPTLLARLASKHT